MEPEALLIDIDGVLTHGGEPLPGAADAVDELRERFPVRFLTNTSRKSSFTLLGELGDAGFDVSREEVFTAPMAAAALLEEGGVDSVLMLTSKDLERDFGEFELDADEPDAVVVGDMGRDFRYGPLNEAFRALMDGAELVAVHRNRYWDSGDGLRLDAGPFVAALEYAAGVEAEVAGKPSTNFFRAALEGVGVSPGDAVMVGDDAYGDVIGAAEAGLGTVLVKGGKYRPGILEESGAEPDHVVDGLPDVLELF